MGFIPLLGYYMLIIGFTIVSFFWVTFAFWINLIKLSFKSLKSIFEDDFWYVLEFL